MNPHIEYITPSKGKYLDPSTGYTIPGYYFWDETATKCHGPYFTLIGCQIGLDIYVKGLNKGVSNGKL